MSKQDWKNFGQAILLIGAAILATPWVFGATMRYMDWVLKEVFGI